jgi:hypothetical protein
MFEGEDNGMRVPLHTTNLTVVRVLYCPPFKKSFWLYQCDRVGDEPRSNERGTICSYVAAASQLSSKTIFYGSNLAIL